ncbi:3-oxoacyl-[acyl-carrier-protein] synthase II, partial sequence, partial [Chondrus crispus]
MTTRVLVTGIGLVTPLGLSTPSTWRAVLSGQTGVKRSQHSADIPVHATAEIARDTLPPVPPLLSPSPAFATFALLAAREALVDAGLLFPDGGDTPECAGYDATRAGVSVGVGMGSLADVVSAAAAVDAGRYRRVSPFLVPRLLVNSAAGVVALRHGLRGPVLSAATACAAGAHAVGDAVHAIQRG